MLGQWTSARLLVVGWAVLLAALLGGASAVDAHPGMSEPAAVTSQPSPFPPVPAPSNPWTWVALVILPGVAAAARLRPPQRLAAVLALGLAVFACETAFHSVHHLNDPQKAERCPVYSASLHLTGLSAAAATPELPPLVATFGGSVVHAVQVPAQVLDGPPPRAPPVRPA
jgi:hypothetical protein